MTRPNIADTDATVHEAIIELGNGELEDNESEKHKCTVPTDMEDKQPTPANNSQDKTAKGTDDEETAEVGVDMRIMIDEETRDLIGMKNDETQTT